jgi:hypothetical protein
MNRDIIFLQDGILAQSKDSIPLHIFRTLQISLSCHEIDYFGDEESQRDYAEHSQRDNLIELTFIL